MASLNFKTRGADVAARECPFRAARSYREGEFARGRRSGTILGKRDKREVYTVATKVHRNI